MTESNLQALPEGYKLNHYVIDSVIGQGGFGIVYRAHHEHFQDQVVIKEHLPGYCAARSGDSVVPQSTNSGAAFDESFKRFFTEGQTLNKLKHENIVRCTDLFTANGTAYLVMAYEEGMSLFDLLVTLEGQGGHYSEEQLLGVFIPLADGIAFCHEQDVLHRDIKPGNVYIRRVDGSPVLLDFGAAKRNFSQGPQSEAPITDFYAPPEQNDPTSEATAAIDIHAFGGLMYRVVTGADGPAATTRMLSVSRNQPDPMLPSSKLAKGKYSKALLSLIDKCLSYHAEKRPPSMRDVKQQLEKIYFKKPSAKKGGSKTESKSNKLKELIDLAGSDGVISQNEMSYLLNKAQDLGLAQNAAMLQITQVANAQNWIIEGEKKKTGKNKVANDKHLVSVKTLASRKKLSVSKTKELLIKITAELQSIASFDYETLCIDPATIMVNRDLSVVKLGKSAILSDHPVALESEIDINNFCFPPEVYKLQNLDEKSVIYSLSAIAYFCLTGKPIQTHARIKKENYSSIALTFDGDPFVASIDRGLKLVKSKRPTNFSQWTARWGKGSTLTFDVKSTKEKLKVNALKKKRVAEEAAQQSQITKQKTFLEPLIEKAAHCSALEEHQIESIVAKATKNGIDSNFAYSYIMEYIDKNAFFVRQSAPVNNETEKQESNKNKDPLDVLVGILTSPFLLVGFILGNLGFIFTWIWNSAWVMFVLGLLYEWIFGFDNSSDWPVIILLIVSGVIGFFSTLDD